MTVMFSCSYGPAHVNSKETDLGTWTIFDFESQQPLVKAFRELLCLPVDEIKVDCDSASIKGFMTYLMRRHNGSVRREFR